MCNYCNLFTCICGLYFIEMKIIFIFRLYIGLLSEMGAKMTKSFKNLQII